MLTGQILLQLIAIIIMVQICGFLCKRIGQQWVIGEIIAGLALGPSFLGALLPGIKLFPVSTLPTLQVLGDLGLILYMFSLGSQLDIQMMRRHSRDALLISVSGMLVPLGLGALLGFFLYPEFAGTNATSIAFILLVGSAMSVTAFPVLARLLTEKRMLGTKIGLLSLTSASINDVIAWCLLALVVAIIHAQGMMSVLRVIALTLVFATVMILAVRPLLTVAAQRISSKQAMIALSLVILFISAYTTDAIGIHPAFGAFLAGIILPRTAVLNEQTQTIEQVNGYIFLPLFFVYSGLQTQIGLIHSPILWLICLLVFVVACVGKLAGGLFATRLTGESWHVASCVGVLLNTRGLVELIMLNIGLSLGVLSPVLFTMMVIMAIATTVMASPLLSLLGYRGSAPAQTAQQAQETQEVTKQAV